MLLSFGWSDLDLIVFSRKQGRRPLDERRGRVRSNLSYREPMGWWSPRYAIVSRRLVRVYPSASLEVSSRLDVGADVQQAGRGSPRRESSMGGSIPTADATRRTSRP